MTKEILNYKIMRNVLLGHTEDLSHIYSNMSDQHMAVLLEFQVNNLILFFNLNYNLFKFLFLKYLICFSIKKLLKKQKI